MELRSEEKKLFTYWYLLYYVYYLPHFNPIWFEINNQIEYVPAIIFIFEFGFRCTSSKSWKIGFLSSQYCYAIQRSWSYWLDIRGLSWWGAKKLGLWLGRVESIRSSKCKNTPSWSKLMLVKVRRSGSSPTSGRHQHLIYVRGLLSVLGDNFLSLWTSRVIEKQGKRGQHVS